MHPGVDDQPRGAKCLRLQMTEAAVRIAVEAEVEAESLGIELPSLAVGVAAVGAAKLGSSPSSIARAICK